MIKAVIFDLDGTLLNTLNDLADCVNHVLANHDYPTHPLDAYRYFVGNGMAKLIERALPENRKSERDAILSEFYPIYDQHKADKTAPYPGMVSLLETLQSRGLQVAVASNKVQSAMQPLMEYYFPTIRFTAALGQRDGIPIKPDAAIVNDIMAIGNVSHNEVLYVGDTSVDMQTAANAHVTSVGVLWGFRTRDELAQSGAKYIIEKPTDLLRVIETENQYEKITEHIFQCLPMYHKIGSAAYKEGMENIDALMDILNHPEKKIRTIHVAGTNGKGSVTHLLSSYFQEMGLKTGLYTSPHLVDFRERIKINGKMMKKQAVIDFFTKHETQFDQVSPSFFEMATALAFDYFASQKVDIAIIEVGLGGRLDATNIITPDVAIITNISKDHTNLLGDTLPKIAFEKAGIIKPNVPVVIGEFHEETFPVFQEVAAQRYSPLTLGEDIKVTELSDEGSTKHITIKKGDMVLLSDVVLPLPGNYQLKNIATFVAALQVLGYAIDEHVKHAIENVITNTHLQGRWQVVSTQPITICDTGHNVGGLAENMAQLQGKKCNQLHVVVGFVNDKDVEGIMELMPKDAIYYICKANTNRALEPNVLQQIFQRHQLQTVLCSTVSDAYKKALAATNDNDMIYIGGSNFIVGDWLSEFGDTQVEEIG